MLNIAESATFSPKSGQSGSAITHSRKLRPLVQLQITNMLYVQFHTHSLQFKHPIGSKQICHLIILLEIKTTNSTANFQNVVCLISHNLLLNHPIEPKWICHHSKLLLETETTNPTANFQNFIWYDWKNILANYYHPFFLSFKFIAPTY